MSDRRFLARALIGMLAFVALLALPSFLPEYYVELATKIVIFALFAMSLDLLLGYTGLASLGHAAYFGIAAYATGLLSLRLGWPAVFALPAGVVVAAMTAALFGLLALRARGSYFLMITFALAQVLWGIVFGWHALTGGDDGLPGVPRPEFGTSSPQASTAAFYFFTLVLVGVASVLLVRIVNSPFGYALRGIRESESRMLALGYNVWRYKYVSFILGGAFAGLAGCLYVYLNRFASPDYVHVIRSAEVLLMVILGGAGTLIGPAIGAAIIVLSENIISAYSDRWVMLLGLVYIAVALFAPTGLAGLVHDRLKRRAGP
jgi:branched-chain amino acid transport system permease protein